MNSSFIDWLPTRSLWSEFNAKLNRNTATLIDEYDTEAILSYADANGIPVKQVCDLLRTYRHQSNFTLNN
jgi:hypothetical protein